MMVAGKASAIACVALTKLRALRMIATSKRVPPTPANRVAAVGVRQEPFILSKSPVRNLAAPH